MTTTQSMAASIVCSPARRLLGLGQGLLEGVDADKARCKPEGVDANHPVFIYGHLSIYPDMVLNAIGRNDLTDPKSEKWHEFFMHGHACKDNCDCYPPLDEARAFWVDRFETAINAVAEPDESVFAKQCPLEGLREMCPTVGEMCNFMLVMHTSFHLGQMSTWRRCMGLGAISM